MEHDGADDRVAAGACIECGYDISGLSHGGVCPECGLPVARSLMGDRLEHSSPRYLAEVVRGLSWVLWAILAQIVMMVLAIIVGFALASAGGAGDAFVLIIGFAYLGVGVFSLLGYWKMTVADPRYSGTEAPSRAREVIRVAVIAQAITMAASQFLSIFAPAPNATVGITLFGLFATLLGLVGAVVWVVQFFAVMRYMAFFAKRMPDEKLLRRAKRNQWLLPVLAVASIVTLGITGLIALILYWNHLDAVRKRLRLFLERAQLHDAAGEYDETLEPA